MQIHLNANNTKDEPSSLRETHNKHEQFIERAAILATKSDLVNHRHGCVIVCKRGRIISEGYNYMWRNMSIHAEIDALSKLKKRDLSTCSMYVVRIGTDKMGNPLKYSRPCEKCTEAIYKYGIGKVFYSTSFNFVMCSKLIKINSNGINVKECDHICAHVH